MKIVLSLHENANGKHKQVGCIEQYSSSILWLREWKGKGC